MNMTIPDNLSYCENVLFYKRNEKIYGERKRDDITVAINLSLFATTIKILLKRAFSLSLSLSDLSSFYLKACFVC